MGKLETMTHDRNQQDRPGEATMRLPRVRLTVLRMMLVVAVVASILPPAVYLHRVKANLDAYSEWASNTSPNRAPHYIVPYPEAGSWEAFVVAALGFIAPILCFFAVWWPAGLRRGSSRRPFDKVRTPADLP